MKNSCVLIIILLIFMHIILNSNEKFLSFLKILPDYLKNKNGYIIFSLSFDECYACINELQAWQVFHEKYQTTNGFVLLLKTDRQREVIEKFKELFKINYEIIKDIDGNIASSIGLDEVASVGIYSRSGELRYKHNLGSTSNPIIKENFVKIDSLIKLNNNIIYSLKEIDRIVYKDSLFPIGSLVFVSPVQYYPPKESFIFTDRLFQQIVITDQELHPVSIISKNNFEELGIKGNIYGATRDSNYIVAMFETYEWGEDIKFAILIFDSETRKYFKLFYNDNSIQRLEAPLRFNNGKLFIGIGYVDILGRENLFNNGTIGIYDIREGKLEKRFAPLDKKYEIGNYPKICYNSRFDIDENGYCYVVQPLSYKINKYDNNGNLVKTFGEPSLKYHIEPYFEKEPSLDEEGLFLEKSTIYFSVIAGEDNNIYVAYREEDDVFYCVYSNDGNFLYRFKSPGGFLVRVDKKAKLYFIEHSKELIMKKMIRKIF